jgi:hypothetical protein
MFDKIKNLTIVNQHEIRVTMSTGEKFQKMVSATGSKRETYFTRDNLLVIGASMFRTEELRKKYPTESVHLYEVLYEIPASVTPSRKDLAKAITAILRKWDKDCVECEGKPLSHDLLKDKNYLKLAKEITRLRDELSNSGLENLGGL